MKTQEKMQELKNKNDIELGEELIALRREQFNMRMQKGLQAAAAVRSNNLKQVRRTIARIKTILSERVKEKAGKKS